MFPSLISRTAILTALLLVISFALGQPHQPAQALVGHTLIKDIAFGNQGSLPRNFVKSGDFIFFVAQKTTTAFDVELFAYNTLTASTALVKEIQPGAFGGFNNTAAIAMVDAAGTLIFSADDGTHGIELWKSDGTEAGTVMIKDINVGSGSGIPFTTPMVAIGNKAFFVADTGSTGNELWVSDGTSAGTIQLTNFPGTGSGVDTNVPFVVMDGFVYFSGGVTFTGDGRELWRSDGTVIGTTQVKNIRPGDSNSLPANLTVLGSTLFFTANDGTHGVELWKSDGSDAGTVLVKDIRTDVGVGSEPQQLTAFGAFVYFTANDGTGRTLWRSNGLEAQTLPAPNFSATGLNPPSIARLTAAAGGLAFYNTEGNLRVLWEYNPTTEPKRCQDSAGRQIVNSIFVALAQITPQTYLNMVYLPAYHPDFGVELARCVPNSSLPNANFYDLTPGAAGGFPLHLRVIENFVYFAYNTEANGNEPHRYDPFTPASFSLLGDIILTPKSSSPALFYNAGEQMLFSADTSLHGGELWISDGTPTGTQLVKDINPYGSSLLFGFVELGGYIYFAASDSFNGRELWRTDGTEAGTEMVTNINGFLDGLPISPTPPVVYNNKLYFAAGGGNFGTGDIELWEYDPVTETAQQVVDLVVGANGSHPQELTRFNGLIYYSAFTPATGFELWATDGTAAGTVLVKDINPGTGSSHPSNLFVIGNTLYFTAFTTDFGVELWKSDGTEAGTEMVKDILPNEDGTTFFKNFMDFNGKLVFSAGGIAGPDFVGYRPWISDGTEAGTFVLKGDHLSNTDPIGPTAVTASFGQLGTNFYFGGLVGFSGDSQGIELWISDGTPGNTNLISNIHPDPGSSIPDQFINFGSRLFFNANNGANGRELWFLSPNSIFPQFTGFDINLGPGNSNITQFGDLNGIILIGANDGANGQELHAFRAYYPVYLPNIIR